MRARWTVSACDPAGTPWDIGTFTSPAAALKAMEATRFHYDREGRRSAVLWIQDPDEPEDGDVTDEAEELVAEEGL